MTKVGAGRMTKVGAGRMAKMRVGHMAKVGAGRVAKGQENIAGRVVKSNVEQKGCNRS